MNATAKPGLTLLLAGLAMFGPFAIDTMFPAFPAIAAEFGADDFAMQQTLSIYLVALALMSLVHGPLSDALGRRPVVMGGVALFTGQFDLLPVRSPREAGKLPSDLNGVIMPVTTSSMTFIDGKQVVKHDRDSPAYVFLGPTKPVESADVVTLLDPELPAWIHKSLAQSVPEVLKHYAGQLGPARPGKPTVIASWNGATPGITSRGGGVLFGQIIMEYEGAGLVTETPERRAEDVWFVAHEAAHFWLGQTVSYQFARDTWITEGGSDLLAARPPGDVRPGHFLDLGQVTVPRRTPLDVRLPLDDTTSAVTLELLGRLLPLIDGHCPHP